MHPQMLRREIAEGHVVGNHTYLHPHLDSITPRRLHQELNETQRIIESVTGRQALLFRSPYDTNALPTEWRAAERYAAISQLGYICVGANAGADDWVSEKIKVLKAEEEEKAKAKEEKQAREKSAATQNK